MKLKKYLYLFFFTLIFSCSKKESEPVKSSAKSILSFTINSVTPNVKASIDTIQRTVTALLPIGTNLSNLTPSIIVSSKAIISPASGISQDFTKPVTYTITAEDGSVKTYIANIVENLELCKDASFNLKVNTEILKISRAEISPYYSLKSKQFVMGYFFKDNNNKNRYLEIFINNIEDFKTGTYSINNNSYQKMEENERYNLTGSMLIEKINVDTFSAKFILDATYASDKLIIEACIQNFPISIIK